MSAVTISLEREAIDWGQLTQLYQTVGLVAGRGRAGDGDGIRAAFTASSRVATAWQQRRLVGAGRVLTDFLCYATVFDLGVLPDCQHQGIGRTLLEHLLAGLDGCCIHLTSTFGNEPFYARLGFRRHRTAMARYPSPSPYLE